jgi:hypothetical protein
VSFFLRKAPSGKLQMFLSLYCCFHFLTAFGCMKELEDGGGIKGFGTRKEFSFKACDAKVQKKEKDFYSFSMCISGIWSKLQTVRSWPWILYATSLLENLFKYFKLCEYM